MQIHSDFAVPQPEINIRIKTCDSGLVFGACVINRVSCIGASEEDVRTAITESVISNHHAKLKQSAARYEIKDSGLTDRSTTS